MFNRLLDSGERFRLQRIDVGSATSVYALKDLIHDKAIVCQGDACRLLEMVVASFEASPAHFEPDEILERCWAVVSHVAEKAH